MTRVCERHQRLDMLLVHKAHRPHGRPWLHKMLFVRRLLWWNRHCRGLIQDGYWDRLVKSWVVFQTCI